MASSSSHPAPRDQMPTVVHNLGEETAAGPQDKSVTKADRIPTRLAHYQVQHKLGQGGMGWVVLAEDTKLNRKVALKVMRGRLAADKESRERFVREAKAAAQLRHDNVITIYQVDEDRGVPFFAMELLEGGTLQQRLEYPKPLSIGAAVRIAREIAQGLQVAHERGVIHRDIKPANIWLEAPRGRVKILDFGLARHVNVESGLTHAGEIVGTPHYMSPEQARGKEIDCRTDLFSLGCILYRTTTGKLPFAGETLLATLTAIAVDAPAPVIQLNPQVPHPLADLIERLLAKDPAQRPGSAGEVIEELTAIERDLAPGNRSGSYIDVPATILVQTRPKAVVPLAVERPIAPTLASRPATLPRADGRSKQSTLFTSMHRRRWLWATALLPVIGLAAVAGLWWLVSSLIPQPTTPAVKAPGVRTPPPGVSALDPSFAASKAAAEWALAHGGPTTNVRVRVDGFERGPIFRIDQLPDEPQYSLVKLEMRGSRSVQDADLAKLAQVAALQWLDLSDTKITNGGLSQLVGLSALTTLKLAETTVSDEGLASVVENCPMLKRLDIGHTACTAEVLKVLAPLRQLEDLSLSGLPVGDAQLGQLASHPNLKMLSLQETQVTGPGLGALAAVASLSNLALSDTNVGDQGTQQLAQCKQLETLVLNHCQLTDSGLEHLATLPRLVCLEIWDNQQLHDEGLAKLDKVHSLKRLLVTTGQFSEAARNLFLEKLPGCEIKLIDVEP